MKFSEQWLRQRVNIEASTQELVDKLTMAGLEVDSVRPVAAKLSGIIVAEIVDCQQHPDADKLKITRVSTGAKEFQVICGAPNARIGIKVPFAMIGATLPDNVTITKAKLRGIESFGMLCAQEEIGLGESFDGLMELSHDACLGQDIFEHLNLKDCSIDVDLTPNRGDCLSILGLAREVSANFLTTVVEEPIMKVPATIEDKLAINVISKNACPRYIGRVIRNVDVSCQTPLWLTERLRRSGIRSIDPIVDVTNYVMLELGQPMHGFDLAKLDGQIQVRMAEIGEKLLLLDGQEITLNDSTLVITDEQKVLAVAGVIGGRASGVSTETQDIFLESAFFDPVTISGKARSYGLHTESSHRFERGVDFQLQDNAIERATALILNICGGKPGPVINVVNKEYLPERRDVRLRSSKAAALLGVTIEDSHIESLLTRLGLTMTPITASNKEWRVAIPSWRFDISIEEDLIEEIGRLYGYNNLPVTTPSIPLKIKKMDEAKVRVSDIRRVIVSRDYQETISFSFIDPQLHTLFNPEKDALALTNPISSDLSVMRTSLLPSLVQAVAYNLNRQQSRVRLFETGQVFIKENKKVSQKTIRQTQRLAAVITGNKFPESWDSDSQKVDFYDLKGDIEVLLAMGGNSDAFHFAKGEHPAMHPGQCAILYCGDKMIGYAGALHPSVAKKMDLSVDVYLAEFDLEPIINGTVNRFKGLSKFPEVRRDLAFTVAEEVHAAKLCQIIKDEVGDYLHDIRIFDVYTGKGVEKGHKSLALGLTFRHPSCTLKDRDVNELVDKVVAKLKHDVNASLRT
ncbi:MAG: phenylalanine--tRNA ligase subunit beta [Candidatus Endonucleobacter bathymodioli]|uniref:Phenylalanine--tRNA ligase beta subunit n=1 Tax=Candidatus Endonucleibacter bathymodioli TaxID=539814 RepID=A0AA90NL41_9GAMM|nr:phenylalanine--tRNA ligase subunit beta [Candidatus Endonucleobacter bathymodioli]